MDADTQQKIIFLFVGWLLGILATFITIAIKELWDGRKQKRRLFARINLMLLDVSIQLAIIPIWREAGGIDKTLGALSKDEFMKKRLPPPPPFLPSYFDDLLQEFAQWEKTYGGRSEVIKELKSMQYNLLLLQQQYEGLSEFVKSGAEVPENSLKLYTKNTLTIKDSISNLNKLITSIEPRRRLRLKR